MPKLVPMADIAVEFLIPRRSPCFFNHPIDFGSRVGRLMDLRSEPPQLGMYGLKLLDLPMSRMVIRFECSVLWRLFDLNVSGLERCESSVHDVEATGECVSRLLLFADDVLDFGKDLS
ncbi:unnamed protein product [Cochlearia groenlandica]